MLYSSSNFDTYNQATKKNPVWIIEFDSIATYLASGTFSGITSSYKKRIKELKVIPSKIELLDFRTDFYGYEFTLIDDSTNTILGLIANNAMGGRKVTIKLGFAELMISDFVTLPAAKIITIRIDAEQKEYTFKAQSYLSQIGGPLFRDLAYTQLDADAARADGSLTVLDTSEFQAASNSAWSSTLTYVLVGNEVMRYSAKTATTFTVVRGQCGEQTEHKKGEGVYELIYITDAFRTLMQLLTTTSDGTNGSWDLGIAGWGIGIDINYIDYWQICNELSTKFDFSSVHFMINPWKERGTIETKIRRIGGGTAIHNRRAYGTAIIDNGLEWLKEKFLPHFPAYLIVTSSGKLGIKVWDVRGGSEGYTSILENHVLDIPEIEECSKDILNKVEIRTGYCVATDEHKKKYEIEQDESIAAYGEMKPMVLNSLEPATDGTLYASVLGRKRFAERCFARYGNPVIKTKINSMMRHQLIQASDAISLTHSKLPLLRDGTLGWTAEGLEVTQQHINYALDNIKVSIEADAMLVQDHADFQDVHVFSQSDMDDYNLSESGDFGAGNLQAADAYVDQSSHKACHVMVGIELTQPGESGGSTWEYITIKVLTQNPVGTNVSSKSVSIYYDETSDEKLYAEIYDLNVDGNDPPVAITPSRIRIDWTAHSGSHPPTNVEVRCVKLWDFKGGKTETELS